MIPLSNIEQREENSGCFERKETIPVYLSGKFGHWERMSIYMRELEQEIPGVTITHDWTSDSARALDAKEAAIRDLNGVRECTLHVIVFDDPYHPYRGTFCELGAALASSIPIIVCNLMDDGDDAHNLMANVFTQHPCVVTTTTSWSNTKEAICDLIERKRVM